MATTELRSLTDDNDQKGCSLADVPGKLEKGRIGHRAAMLWLNATSYDHLEEIIIANGRQMPEPQPMRVEPETRELVRAITCPIGA